MASKNKGKHREKTYTFIMASNVSGRCVMLLKTMAVSELLMFYLLTPLSLVAL